MNQFLAEITARAALPLGLLFLFGYNLFILKNLRHRWMLMDLMGFFAVLQLWVAPALRYHFEGLGWTLDPNNNMAVPATVYFPVVIPMLLALVVGIRVPAMRWRIPFLHWEHKGVFQPSETLETKDWPYLPWILLALGLFGFLTYPFVPSFLRQPCILLKGLLWVSAAYAVPRYHAAIPHSGFRIPHSKHSAFETFGPRLAGWISVAVLGLDAITSTFFGTFVLGMVFLGMIWLYGRPYPWVRFFGFQVVGAVLVVFLLSFKFVYRKAVKSASADVPERISLFFTTAWDALTPPYHWLGPDVALERLNQGVYVAHVMAYVPEHAPFGYGRELSESFWAAFVPRLLWKNKHMAGGQYNRERFLGVPNATYSFNIGTVGEAWAHFGWWGFVYCSMYGWTLQQIQQLLLIGSRRWFTPMWLFSFYLFAPTMLMEGDSGIVWNHVVKASMVVVAIAVFASFWRRRGDSAATAAEDGGAEVG